jgi:hypothetical protein
VSLITAGHPTSRGRSTSQASQGFNPGRAGETKVCGLLRSKVLQQQAELFLGSCGYAAEISIRSPLPRSGFGMRHLRRQPSSTLTASRLAIRIGWMGG